MTIVRQLQSRDVENVVALISNRLAADACGQTLINPEISTQLLSDALHSSLHATWVAEEEGRVVGHLYGALFKNEIYGNGVWIGPDGASFESVEVLSDLYSAAGAEWITHDVLEHYVWTLDDAITTAAWYDMGFARMHLRGVMELNNIRRQPFPTGYRIRRGGDADLELAVALDGALDDAQRQGPSFSIGAHGASKREVLYETLVDPDVHHYIVECDGRGVAQCVTFPLAPRRGSFDNTMHLSGVTVLPDHQGRGVATSMVTHAFANAVDAGFRYAETNWRVTNRRAQSFWRHYGFQSTYVRLHRTIGSG